MPIVGPTGIEGLIIATGHYRSGVLLTPITAKLIGEHLTGKTLSADIDRFSPMRFQAANRASTASQAPR